MTSFDRFEARHTAPPKVLVQRTAAIQLGVVNTVRYPGDLFARRDSVWFEPGTDPQGVQSVADAPRPVRENNRLRFLVDGEEAMRAMVQAIEATASGDFIYMANWWADPSLTPPGSSDRLGEILGRAADRGVQVRAMIWKFFFDPAVNVLDFITQGLTDLPLAVPFELIELVSTLLSKNHVGILGLAPPFNLPHGGLQQNLAMVNFINSGTCSTPDTSVPDGPDVVVTHVDSQGNTTRVGAAIHDDRLNKLSFGAVPITVGSHHHKILCVRNALTAPVGTQDPCYAELFDGVAAGALWQRLILAKRAYFKAQDGSGNLLHPIPRGRPDLGDPPHPRDWGYDQSQQTNEPLTQTADVRPYDVHDDPIEIPIVGIPIIGPTLAPLFDIFVDPLGIPPPVSP
jgi:hypothetical protein